MATTPISEVLGHPVWGELPEEVRKVRRNLLVFGLIGVVMDAASVGVDPGAPILGIKFTGLNDALITLTLLIVLLYQLVHFCWYAMESLIHWRVRVTGTRSAVIQANSTFAEKGADYPSDPRQSTLYHWWSIEANKIGNLQSKADAFEKWLAASEQDIKTLLGPTPDSRNLNAALNSLGELRNHANTLRRAVEETKAALTSTRIPASLQNFDAWFGLLLRSANARWLLVEVTLPIGIGMAAVAMLLID